MSLTVSELVVILFKLLVVTLAAAVTGSRAITVLEDSVGLTRRRPPLPMRDNPRQEQAAAESTLADVKFQLQGFRSSVLHKPISADGRAEGLTVQDPPKGWPFSEVHIDFNSHIPEKDETGVSNTDAHSSEDGSTEQNQQQQQLQQKPRLQPQHKAAILKNSDTHFKAGLIQTTDSRKFSQPSSHIITVNRNQPFGSAYEKGDQKTINELNENVPKEISGLQTRPQFSSAAPPRSSVHQKQRLNAIKQEVSTSGSHLLGDGLQSNQQQQYSIQQSAGHYQATSSGNTQQSEIRAGDPHYVWRDVGPGLEISSNAPQLAGGPQQSLAEARHPRTDDLTEEEPDSTASGHGTATGTSFKVGQVSNFDHANALGHSANFGYRDALLSFPPQLQTRGTRAYETQGLESGVDKEGTQYKNTGHNIQNSLPHAGRSGAAFPGTNVGPGAAGTVMKDLGGQHSQQQQLSQTNSLLPQANYALDSTADKVLLNPNNGLIPGIPGSLILGNDLYAGYDSRQNKILSTQGMINTGGHVIPLQVFYLPVSSPHIGQLGNHQMQIGTLDQMQHSIPTFDDSHIGQGIINTAAKPYIGLMNRGLYGYAGIAGLPLLQGHFLGIQGMHGVSGGVALQSGHVGGMHLGSNHLSLSSDVPAPDNNLAQDVYKPAFQSRLQATGQQQNNTGQAQGNQQTPLRAGQDALVPYQYQHQHQHQQATKQHVLAPQVRVHPNGLGVRLLQHHPVPHKTNNVGGVQRLSFGGHHPSSLPAQDNAGATPKGGYETFSLSPHMHQSIRQQHTPKFNPLIATADTRISTHLHHELKRPQASERVSMLTALPKIQRPLGDKSAEGQPKRYFGSRPLTTTGPLSNSLFTTSSHYAMDMRPRHFGSSFIRK
jgi:hypothetical protein